MLDHDEPETTPEYQRLNCHANHCIASSGTTGEADASIEDQDKPMACGYEGPEICRVRVSFI